MRRLVFVLSVGLIVLALYTFQRGGQPDPSLINLAVRATVFAMPSPVPRVVEVTREVEVTRMVEVVRYVEVTATLVPASPTPSVTPTPIAAVATAPVVALFEAQRVDAAIADDAAGLPKEVASAGGCPISSSDQFNSIPVTGARASHLDSQHGDLNLALRGYVPVDAALSLVDISGPTDGDAPQLPGVFGRAASIGSAYQARDWNWACGDLGCRGDVLGNVEVSLIGLATSPGERVAVPTRGAEIYGGGYVALVVYADESRLTLVYTREDSVANGYAVHLEDFCVDHNLLNLYRANNSAGRGNLPAVRNGEAVGVAHYAQVIVAVRDRGTFHDPRSRKDWWRGY